LVFSAAPEFWFMMFLPSDMTPFIIPPISPLSSQLAPPHTSAGDIPEIAHPCAQQTLPSLGKKVRLLDDTFR
jgi:hypothetical protein